MPLFNREIQSIPADVTTGPGKIHRHGGHDEASKGGAVEHKERGGQEKTSEREGRRWRRAHRVGSAEGRGWFESLRWEAVTKNDGQQPLKLPNCKRTWEGGNLAISE